MWLGAFAGGRATPGAAEAGLPGSLHRQHLQCCLVLLLLMTAVACVLLLHLLSADTRT